MSKLLYCLILLFGTAQALAAETALDQLTRLLQETQSLRGEFTQHSFGLEEELLEESTGHFKLLQPGFFFWEIVSPDSQIFLSDSNELTHYDKDLEQVTVQRAELTTGFTPAQLLSSGGEGLATRFDVTDSTTACEKDSCFRLIPISVNRVFSHMNLQFEGNQLQAIEVVDNFNQLTRITLTIDHAGMPLSEADFQIDIPPGVDIIRNE